ncbi:Stp1/IreP family PP2C-type Ser/Thr phosphatase [Paenibacillus sp. WLX1005]|uniref:Stp1/IreP family PP2C-type Ser/Thr phosphatase n=1 Tax=unclassified Paenibacillus TaxID=185978 RepID=UPI003983ED81
MIKAAQLSDKGRVRQVNEDSVWIGSIQEEYVLGIVADGMGGHRAGDTASQLAVQTVVSDLQGLEVGMSAEACRAALHDAILHANDVVFHTAQTSSDYHNMGTTVVAVLLRGNQGIIGHIGDSRAYLVGEDALRLITQDHSLVNELLRTGQISQEEAASHPRRNVLTRALGTDAEVNVELDDIALSTGEVLLLCSDGLTNMVAGAQIETVALAGIPLEERARHLVALALEAGGEDNITVALFEFTDSVSESDDKGWTP